MLLLGNTFAGELGERARALLYASFLHGKLRDFVQVTLARGSEWGSPLVSCRLKFSYFVGSRLNFSIFVGSRLNFLIFVGCWKNLS